MAIGALFSPPDRQIARHLVKRGNAARIQGRFAEAALLLEEALELRPGDARLRIQCGHMRKEAGDLPAAEAHYLAALERLPRDADLALQLGHFYKISARPLQAREWYRHAAELAPEWEVPPAELAALEETGVRTSANPELRGRDVMATVLLDEEDFEDAAAELATAGTIDHLVPKLVPRKLHDMVHDHRSLVDVRRLGRKEEGFWGLRRTLRGVEAVRGFCVSDVPIVELELLLNGLAIHRGPVEGGYPLRFERDKDFHRKYVFNVWLDFAPYVTGLHAFEVRLIDAEGAMRSFHDHVVIAAPVDENEYPGSDALVSINRDDPRSLEEQIRTRPSMIRDAAREPIAGGIRNVLIMRTDQLGDLVASIPALQRLRAMLPDANLVGLLTAANADLARTLGLFDEVVVAEFPDDRLERRRLMPLAEQEKLRERLAPYQFDIALDLAQANVSRDLLRLSGARFLYGTGGEEWPWLSADFIFNSHDRWNGMDNTPHSTKVLALVETLGALLKTSAPIIRRDDLAREMLEPFGIDSNERYILLHAGARVEFSRWPGYAELAQTLIERSGLTVVLMTEDPLMRPMLPEAVVQSDRLRLLDTRLSFDLFDAFVSHATVVVGNDSGPKHLASLRGVPTVTLFTARINWSEWGQENVGSIVSRRVPCAGCAIFHDVEECGKGFACIRDIGVDEVFETVMRYV